MLTWTVTPDSRGASVIATLTGIPQGLLLTASEMTQSLNDGLQDQRGADIALRAGVRDGRSTGHTVVVDLELSDGPHSADRLAMLGHSSLGWIARAYLEQSHDIRVSHGLRTSDESDITVVTTRVLTEGAPPGLGSHVHWDRRLDARVAAAVMGVPHTRRVEWGDGFAIAAVPGSQAHDEIVATDEGFARTSSHAGGVEGGMSSGEPLHLSAVTKLANAEGSNDVSPSLVGLTVSSLVALALTEEVLRKFGGSSATEAADNSKDYRKRLIQQFPRD